LFDRKVDCDRGRWELRAQRNEVAAAEFEARRTVWVSNMTRSALVVSAALLVAALLATAFPMQANAQSRAHNFSGLCAFYPTHGKGLTAAHRTLPFGTHVRVTDPKTKRSVVVIINDRGPFGKHRVLDLSPSAARALNMVDRGVIFVQAEVL
jgi:rare lipoprotein A